MKFFIYTLALTLGLSCKSIDAPRQADQDSATKIAPALAYGVGIGIKEIIGAGIVFYAGSCATTPNLFFCPGASGESEGLSQNLATNIVNAGEIQSTELNWGKVEGEQYLKRIENIAKADPQRKTRLEQSLSYAKEVEQVDPSAISPGGESLLKNDLSYITKTKKSGNDKACAHISVFEASLAPLNPKYSNQFSDKKLRFIARAPNHLTSEALASYACNMYTTTFFKVSPTEAADTKGSSNGCKKLELDKETIDVIRHTKGCPEVRICIKKTGPRSSDCKIFNGF